MTMLLIATAAFFVGVLAGILAAALVAATSRDRYQRAPVIDMSPAAARGLLDLRKGTSQ